MNLKNYQFALEDTQDFQRLMLFQHLFVRDITVEIFKDPLTVPGNWIPFGTCEWTEKILGTDVKPDYYPKFLEKYLFRKIWESSLFPKKCADYFYKPADRYKRFDGRIITCEELISNNLIEKVLPEGPYWISEIVEFVDEWRYFVAYGKVHYGYWYKGAKDIEIPAPDLIDIEWPKDYVGIVDFGTLKDGRLALVECSHGYSFGYYGKDYGEFAESIIVGWEDLNNSK